MSEPGVTGRDRSAMPMAESPSSRPTGPSAALRRRLAPLLLAVFLQGVALWVPIEKLFMTTIGFDAASIGLMAAVYSVAVPALEVPSGILADRWSRRGVLVLAALAAVVSVVVGGLSQNVPMYMVAAFFLGVYFAMQSGTFDAVVYDTVLEETGDSEAFERTIGRVRVLESAALVCSALAGAALAEVASLSTTYFVTVVPLLGSCVALVRFREPRLHRAEESEPLRDQIRATFRTVFTRGRLRTVLLLIVATSMLAQAMLEFGPLWLVALAAPTLLYGPHWAGVTGALGLGGILGSRPWLRTRWLAVVLACLIVGSSLALTLSLSLWFVVPAQVVIVLVAVAVSIPALRRLHDAVASAQRASVASGVGALSWLAFVPFALLIGVVSQRAGTGDAGWLVTVVAVVTGALLVVVLPEERPLRAEPVTPEPGRTFPADRFLPDDDPVWPGHWARLPTPWDETTHDDVVRARTAIDALPDAVRQALVLRDVEGRTPEQVQSALHLSPERERELVHRGRAAIRAHLERSREDPR